MDSTYLVKDSNDKNNKKGNKDFMKLVIMKFLLIVLVTLCGFISKTVYSKYESGKSANSGLEMDAGADEIKPGMSEEEIQAILNKKVAEGMINISMNTNPVFENGKSKGNLNIVNDRINNYPQIVYIVRSDTEEEIYRSKGIPVGSSIAEAALNVNLPKGEYDCVAYFNNVDPDSGAILGTAGANIKVTVKN